MPTYRNEGPGAALVVNSSGESVIIPQGHTVESHFILTDTDRWTQTAATPHWNPFLGVASPTGDAATDDDVDIVSGAKTVQVLNYSGQTVTMYLKLKTNTPGVPIVNNTEYTLQDDDLASKADKLVFAFGGEVTVGLTVVQKG